VHPVVEYEWRAGILTGGEQVQSKIGKFAHQRKDSNWQTLAQCRKVARICAVFKVYMGEQAWKAIGARLQRPYYLRVVMIGKLAAESKGQISENIPLQIGPFSSSTNCLHML
jgi:hypothetical protein